jgi:hypothetical protein
VGSAWRLAGGGRGNLLPGLALGLPGLILAGGRLPHVVPLIGSGTPDEGSLARAAFLRRALPG